MAIPGRWQPILRRWICVLLCLPALPGLLRAQAAPQREVQESHWLRGEPREPSDFQLYGLTPEQFVRLEPAAVRITMPGDSPRPRTFTGVKRDVDLRGDFDITVDFEILQETEAAPPASFATRLGLILQIDNRKTVAVSRTFAERDKRFVAFFQWHDAAGKQQTLSRVVSTQAHLGRLRVVRSGTMLSYFGSEGLDQEFIPVQQYEVGRDDVKDIRLAGQTGGMNAALDGRFANLRLRTGAVVQPLPADVPAVAPAAAPARGRLWPMLAALVVAVLAVGIVLLAVYQYRVARTRLARRAEDADA